MHGEIGEGSFALGIGLSVQGRRAFMSLFALILPSASPFLTLRILSLAGRLAGSSTHSRVLVLVTRGQLLA
ncbi:uncharacterized protein PG986_000251 [Apiospora aurea]|uniref:Uncharacterized protein n=1 Tax=Apiospora aurea TaxID=335848 RepID=A0ABR1QTF7_9PEZI